MRKHHKILFKLTFSKIISLPQFSKNGVIGDYVPNERYRAPLPGNSVNIAGNSLVDNSDDLGIIRIKDLVPGHYDEPAPVSEFHFTPGTPRFLKLGISLNF